MGRLFDFPPALGDISGLQGPFCPDKFLFPIQQIVSLPEFFMDGHVAQPRMSWRHFHVARLANAIERSHLRLCALLVLLSLACFLPGFSSLQPMDRDEPRYAQASKQMLESGDLVDIRFQDEARHKKPVGIYWLQSARVAIGDALGVSDPRTTIALYRIPSLLGGIATVLLTYWAALAFIGRRGAFLAAAFMATSIILMVEARLAKTDAALTACAVATMGALARAYLSRGAGILPRRTLAFFWLGLAAGILIKGPLVPMFVGLAAACLWWRERSGRWLLALRPIHGAVFTLLVVLPWFVAIAIKSGGAFYSASVGHDMLGKVGTAQTYHWAPPGYYLLAFFATFWPGAILAAIAVPFAWIHRRDEPVTFALAWIVPSWLVFEIVPTKLPHYVMPLYPAIAILTVMAISRHFVGPHRPFARVATVLIPFIPLGLAASSPAPPGISTTHCRIARCRCSSCRRLRASMRGGYSQGARFSRASGRVSPRPCFSRLGFSAWANSTCVRSSCRPEWPRSPTISRVPILESARSAIANPAWSSSSARISRCWRADPRRPPS